MKKRMVWLVIVFAVLLGLLVPVYAQEPGLPDWLLGVSLPDSAGGGVQQIAVWLAVVAGLAANAIVDAIKGLPILKDGERSKIAGPAGNLVAAIISVLSGYVVGWLGVAAGLLDSTGLWQVLLFVWPMAKGWFESQKLARLS